MRRSVILIVLGLGFGLVVGVAYVTRTVDVHAMREHQSYHCSCHMKKRCRRLNHCCSPTCFFSVLLAPLHFCPHPSFSSSSSSSSYYPTSPVPSAPFCPSSLSSSPSSPFCPSCLSCGACSSSAFDLGFFSPVRCACACWTLSSSSSSARRCLLEKTTLKRPARYCRSGLVAAVKIRAHVRRTSRGTMPRILRGPTSRSIPFSWGLHPPFVSCLKPRVPACA